jgi:hypothetical protein
MNKINIMLDDERLPLDIKNLMGVHFVEDWMIVRTYNDFKTAIDENIGNIGIVSFDHDIACFEEDGEKTGVDCVQYLLDKCIENGIELCDWFIHTQNVEGRKNIKSKFLTYLKVIENKIPDFKYHNSGIIKNKIC